MKRTLIILCMAFTVFTILASCEKGDASVPTLPDEEITDDSTGTAPDTATGTTPDTTITTMKVKIGSRSFNATFSSNATATAFKARLPFTLNMAELNGNEKHADLANGLPVNASNPGTIQTGDIMMYGSRTVVLFYKSFSTSYSYTKVGQITDVTGLADAVGSGSVTVVFEP